MQKPPFVIRPANPTIVEGRAYARYLNVAAEGFFNIMLGKRAEEIIGKSYIELGHNYSHQNVLFSELNGRIVGMVSGFTSEQHKAFSDRPITDAAGSQASRMKVVQFLFAPMIRILDTIADGDFYLLSIATDSELRGSGVGSALMNAMEEQAVSSGSSRIVLDVAASNSGARRFYDRRGMAIVSEWPKHNAIPKLKFYRMGKPIP